MERDLGNLSSRRYDLVIIGGGIFGACAAWDAALRGLSVALVERGDFAHATSANCFKVVHGGLRYLQHGDLVRIRESNRERRALLRIAPHLVRPLPILIPTYRRGGQGKALLGAGLRLHEWLTWDRNRGLDDPQQQIPPAHLLSRADCLAQVPSLEREDLTGAVVFHDGQMYSPARLALAFLLSAAQAGAEVANYAEVTGFLRQGDRVAGVSVRDRLSGRMFDIQASVVLNAAGPWATPLVLRHLGLRLRHEPSFSRDAYFITTRRLSGDLALAVQGRTRDPDAVISRGNRHLFLVPWRQYTLAGVWHRVHQGDPEAFSVSERELQGFLDEVNGAYPALALTLDDVSLWGAGLVLFGENRPGATHLSYGKRSLLIDHAGGHGLQGLISLIGVRYTTARGMAEHAVNLVFRKLDRQGPPPATATTPIHGGRIGGSFKTLFHQALLERPHGVSIESIRALVHNHGSEYRAVLRLMEQDPRLSQPLNGSPVLKAEVIQAVRHEMASTLGDVASRRTDLATGEYPGAAALRACAELMASELGWDAARVTREVDEVARHFPHQARLRRDGEISPAAVVMPAGASVAASNTSGGRHP